ncbi:MAG: hypothetical protein WC023_06550 [Rhodocyclaceae bacterium]
MQTAQTILQQLGGNRFCAMTGATNFVGREDGLSFKVGRNAKRVTHVRVTLTPADLYEVEYLAIRGTTIRPVAKSEGVYADMLRDDFTRETGLYTSF